MAHITCSDLYNVLLCVSVIVWRRRIRTARGSTTDAWPQCVRTQYRAFARVATNAAPTNPPHQEAAPPPRPSDVSPYLFAALWRHLLINSLTSYCNSDAVRLLLLLVRCCVETDEVIRQYFTQHSLLSFAQTWSNNNDTLLQCAALTHDSFYLLTVTQPTTTTCPPCPACPTASGPRADVTTSLPSRAGQSVPQCPSLCRDLQVTLTMSPRF